MSEKVPVHDFSRISQEKAPYISRMSQEKAPISENSDLILEICKKIRDLVKYMSGSKTQSLSGQCSRLSVENVIGDFIQKLKNKKLYHFSGKKGKLIAVILIDQNYPECKRLQQIYQDIKVKDSNFEAIWIPLPEREDYGYGTYSRVVQCMPWLTLADPKSIKIDEINDKSPHIIIINSQGSIENQNALSHLMSWGADACPFTKGSLSQLDWKTSLEILFHSTEIKLNNKVIFLYAEPPNQELKMKCTLEKLVQVHDKSNFEIVYVGCFFAERNVAESLEKAYRDATETMNWTKLSFEDMMTFWYRCKYFSDEMVHESNLSSALKTLMRALLNEKRWLVVVDGDGIVTANGMDIVEMVCELNNDEVEVVMKEQLRDSL